MPNGSKLYLTRADLVQKGTKAQLKQSCDLDLARCHQPISSSISGSSPTVAVKRIFRPVYVCLSHGGGPCCLSRLDYRGTVVLATILA